MDFQLGEDELLLKENVRQFCRTEVLPNAGTWDEEESFPADAVARLGELGLLGMEAPEAHGGVELSAVAAACVIEELASFDGSLALTVTCHNNLCVGHIALAGTHEQKERFLPGLAAGESLGAWALADDDGRSDAAAIKTIATREGDHFVLRGRKSFVTGGSASKVLVVLAADKPEAGERGLVALVVDRDAKGVKIEPPVGNLGVRAAGTVGITFEDVRVPADRQLRGAGDCLDDARTVTARARVNMAAMACGLGRAAMETATAYAKEREQFGRPIAAFQAIQWKIANMAADLQAAWCMTLRAAHLRDVGQPFSVAASRAQIFAARAATRAGSEALQVHGGYGYTREYLVERYLRDARLCSLALESSERLRTVVSQAIRERYAGA